MFLYSFVAKKVSRKIFGDLKVGEGEDPFYEEVSFEKRSFWTGSSKLVTKKLEKPIPEYIPAEDREVLRRVRRKAYRLDMMFKICGIRIGWLGIIGIIPVIGDIICLLLSFAVMRDAQKIQGGLPTNVQAEFVGNICIDFALGLIPIVGDVIGIAYKANSRNTLALEHHLKKRYGRTATPPSSAPLPVSKDD